MSVTMNFSACAPIGTPGSAAAPVHVITKAAAAAGSQGANPDRWGILIYW
jgi:hypothetical protein